jgi:phage-related protein
MNVVIWNKKALKTVKSFPVNVRKETGYLIYRLQLEDTLSMPQSRPMSIVGSSCHELRIKGENGCYRVFYYLKVKHQIVIFHAFQKKGQKTPKNEIEQGRKNLMEIIYETEK